MDDKLIFSLDPSSTQTGWCLMKLPEELVKFGLLLPDDPKASSEVRVDDMCKGLWTLLNFWRPQTILIEWTSGKVGRRHTGGGAGLAVYGVAVGSVWRECLAWLRYQPPENQLVTNVHLIRENEWTRGIRKEERAAAVTTMFPECNLADDSGFDVADSVGMCIWFMREQAVRLPEYLI